MPEVSVIMNVRNGAATLREAIDSVLAQSFADWELVVWDDASTDGTPAIVSDYRNSRIRYLRGDRSAGLGRARDAAIRAATGTWLAFLDQDDLWLPEKLASQLSLAGPETGLVYGRTVAFSGARWERDYDHRHEFADLPEGDIFETLFADSCFVSMSSAMLRRSLVNALGAIPDEIETCPDYWLFLAVTASNPARAVQTVVCRYRVHSGSMSRQRARRVDEEMLWLLDQWQWRLPADLVAWRRRVLNTLLAVEDLRRPGHRWSGLARLWREGSLPYLLSRPAARAWRSVRRTVATPRWRLAAPRAGGQVTA